MINNISLIYIVMGSFTFIIGYYNINWKQLVAVFGIKCQQNNSHGNQSLL